MLHVEAQRKVFSSLVLGLFIFEDDSNCYALYVLYIT